VLRKQVLPEQPDPAPEIDDDTPATEQELRDAQEQLDQSGQGDRHEERGPVNNNDEGKLPDKEDSGGDDRDGGDRDDGDRGGAG
jgi:hypothetical protein